MPIIYPKNVFSFSSEDSKYPASNLLEKGEPKSWKCKTPGESSAVVVLGFDKLTTISGIDLGNEGSAFVQVDVGRKKGDSAPKDDEYKTILLTSSLMVPTESRNLTGVNRVRCFAKNALIQEVAGEKWDLIRFECTQPFNKNIQYGLTFVKIHGTQASEECKQLGRFKLREDSPDSDKETTKTSLFSRWKESRGETSGNLSQHSSPAAKIRAASAASMSSKKRSPTPEKPIKTIKVTTPPNRNRSKLMYDDEDEKEDEKMEIKIALDRSRQEKIEKAKQEEKDKYAKKPRKKSDDLVIPDVPKNHVGDKPKTSSQPHRSPALDKSRDKHSKKRQSSPPTPASTRQPTPKKARVEKPTVYKPFNKLLDGVVLAISGIQNPERGEIRQKAIEMGARYRPDWDPTCTHLICAFPNTPKYNQVRDEGRGIITSKNWVLKGHSLKKRLPWRRYALDKRDREKDESEEEILDERSKTADRRMSTDSTDSVEEVVVPREPPTVLSDSDCDTDDEIEKVLKRQAAEKAKAQPPPPSVVSPKDRSTDEDENYNHTRPPSSPKPLTFKDKVFYLDESLSAVDFIKLREIVETRKGTISEELDDQVDFLLASKKPKEMPNKFQGECVKPLWVLESDEMDGFIPLTRYRL